MSQWTHVSGVIRFDGVKDLMPECTIENIKKILGKTCHFDSSVEDWGTCTVPCGSEGSIQYIIYEYYTGLPWVVVVIWGDLRDYGSSKQIDEVKEWFYGVCKVYPLIRQGVLQIDNGEEEIVIKHSDIKDKSDIKVS